MNNFPSEYKSAKLSTGKVTIKQVQFPQKLDKNTLVIKPFYMGICRADVKEVIGSRDIPMDRGPLFGHEFVGEILYAGDQTGFIAGVQVTFNPNITPNRTTGFAEYFFITADKNTLKLAIIPLNQEISINPPWQPEPFACIVHSLDKYLELTHVNNLDDRHVGIIGAGNSGIMFGLYAKYLGAKVKLLNRGTMRIDFTREKDLFNEDEIDLLGNYKEYENKFDVVIVVPTKIEPDILETSTKIVQDNGVLHLYGGTRQNDMLQNINIDKVRREELIDGPISQNGKKFNVSGAYGCIKEDYLKAFNLYLKFHLQFPLEKLISKEISLQEFPEIIISMANNKIDFPGKVLVRP